MSHIQVFLLTSGLITGAMLAGYSARKLGLREVVAEWCMWFVLVIGYSSVSVLSIWNIRLTAADVWLPLLSMVFLTVLSFIALGMAPLFTRNRQMRGLFAVAGGLGNSGITMGAFLCYMLFGTVGLGLAAMYNLTWNIIISVMTFPIARHYASRERQAMALGPLIRRSVFDVRSMGLYASIAGVLLSVLEVRPPTAIEDYHVLPVMTFTTTIVAFFSIGLRLHLRHVRVLLKIAVGLGVVRFLVAPALGLGMAALNAMSPWPLSEVSRNVFLAESLVPTAVTMVAIANLFRLRPREASALFVMNTLAYLALCVPVLLWWFKS